MNELPDDVRALLDAAEAGAPPPPAGLEAAVLAKVTASVAAPAVGLASIPFAAALGKPLAAVALAVGLGGAGLVVVNQNRAPSVTVAPVPAALPQAGTPVPPAEGAALDLDIAPALRNVPVPASDALAPSSDALMAPSARDTESARNAEGARNAESARDTESARDSESDGARAKPKRAIASEGERATDAEARASEPSRSESKLLEEAREALARGDGDRALAQLQEQARLFPRGRLQEERRALTVVAFATRGERVRAQAAARAFEREHPSSLFLEMVRAAVVDEAGP